MEASKQTMMRKERKGKERKNTFHARTPALNMMRKAESKKSDAGSFAEVCNTLHLHRKIVKAGKGAPPEHELKSDNEA